MRTELTRLGVEELMNVEAVDEALNSMGENDTMLLIVNSVCGCAAANARPAVAMARQAPVQPDRYVTVFAGQDLEATARARQYLYGIPPSSPFMALFKGGDPIFVIERRHIEGRTASAIAMDLIRAFNTYCGPDTAQSETVETPNVAETPQQDNGFPKTFRSIM
jgi:putative YphP/YqiW family bacilliredoxin